MGSLSTSFTFHCCHQWYPHTFSKSKSGRWSKIVLLQKNLLGGGGGGVLCHFPFLSVTTRTLSFPVQSMTTASYRYIHFCTGTFLYTSIIIFPHPPLRPRPCLDQKGGKKKSTRDKLVSQATPLVTKPLPPVQGAWFDWLVNTAQYLWKTYGV